MIQVKDLDKLDHIINKIRFRYYTGSPFLDGIFPIALIKRKRKVPDIVYRYQSATKIDLEVFSKFNKQTKMYIGRYIPNKDNTPGKIMILHPGWFKHQADFYYTFFHEAMHCESPYLYLIQDDYDEIDYFYEETIAEIGAYYLTTMLNYDSFKNYIHLDSIIGRHLDVSKNTNPMFDYFDLLYSPPYQKDLVERINNIMNYVK